MWLLNTMIMAGLIPFPDCPTDNFPSSCEENPSELTRESSTFFGEQALKINIIMSRKVKNAEVPVRMAFIINDPLTRSVLSMSKFIMLSSYYVLLDLVK